jgi:signal transduction histidine kinase
MAKIRVRARAVDMLGRQQIAGVPTAIHELFKNAHDAYATRVEVDYYRLDRLLILRDDGYGMTREDFESRWLTLGTESKIGPNPPDSDVWLAPTSQERRPIMGEKGIGRLAIAAIGPQTLVMTRARRKDRIHPLVVSLVHWGLFEIPGIDLDRIEIPVEELDQFSVPDGALLLRLIERVKTNINSFGTAITPAETRRIYSELDRLQFDPSQLDESLVEPRLRNGGTGTHFYVTPTNVILSDDIDNGDGDSASPIEKMLLGFSNTMMPDRPAPMILAEFRDHREDGTVEELIGGSSFFIPEEFKSADQHIEGCFDEFGQFQGFVSIYGQPPVEHVIRWSGAAGRKTECGPFKIKFAYLQGDLKDSRLPPDQWAELSSKLNRIGGLYVYRDGIRILPYGNSDVDFLNIERRRTKSAQDWFFSYRRIFGAVEISAGHNQSLVEKAGREGFRTNRAYREFVSILENFFQRLAVDFFRPTSQYGDAFNATKRQLQHEAELLSKREKMTRVRRKDFGDRLDRFFSDLEKGTVATEASGLKAAVADQIGSIRGISDKDQAAQALLALESEAHKRMSALTASYTVTRPRSVGLTKSQRSDWSAYLRNSAKVRTDVLEPLQQQIEVMIGEAVAGVSLDRRRRTFNTIDAARGTANSQAARLRREVQEKSQELSQSVNENLRNAITRLSAELERTFVDFERTDVSVLDDLQMRAKQREWNSRIEDASRECGEKLESLRDQLQSLIAALAEGETLDATTAALESSAESLREQLDVYVDLAQVGMALGIVQHEFGNTVKTIRSSIRKLKPWADGTPQLRSLYDSLRLGFDHLDGYLKLFAPLSRRLNRQAVDLSGEEIRRYLEDVFDERMRRHAIRFGYTDEFEKRIVHAYPSTILASFVNVVDNAIYWISSDTSSERVIKLDSDSAGFLISNGGPGIEDRIAERIFEFGETTKPGGRGIGLYLSRESLRREGFELTLVATGLKVNPQFRIGALPDKRESEVRE